MSNESTKAKNICEALRRELHGARNDRSDTKRAGQK